ncbi:MAG: sigma-54-dependent Fis family transcriptional regulator [Deferrisomatales bacterium]
MRLPDDYRPEYDSLRDFLVAMAEERSAHALPDRMVCQMASRPHVARSRVWLVGPGDRCPRCPRRPDCRDPAACLHLVASADRPGAEPAAALADDPDGRIPLGHGEAGEAAASRRTVRLADPAGRSGWLDRNPWARGEGILGATFQPMVFKDQVLGVFGIYARIHPSRIPEGPFWTRMIANQAAVAIANARAFEQIEGLKSQLQLENEYLREEVADAGAFGDLVGRSPPLANLLEQVQLVAPTDASVLILGESGTGKELVAREIHRRSRRRDRPLIKVNCAAVPAELYESEFFGHAKGAFTGAVRDRAGRFQAADGGTLFLDEVGEIPLPLQGKLLRVLQEGCYERIGEETTRRVDVRIVAASNRDLKQEAAAGRFRQDLYYRLNVFPIEVAPLRRRGDDVALLAEHFLRVIAAKMNRPVPGLTRAHVAELRAYEWPGNVRELQNVVERAVITSRPGRLRFDLPPGPTPFAGSVPPPSAEGSPGDVAAVVTDAEMQERVRQNLTAALSRCGGRIYGPGGAAALLGISPTTLSSRVHRLGLRDARPDPARPRRR